jgi:hypothetical protein
VNTGLFSLPKRATARRGGLALLQQRTANNSAVLDFADWYSPEYDEYQIHLIDVLPANTGANFNIAMRCSVDGGVSYDAGNNYSWVQRVAVVGGAGLGGANSTSYIGLVLMGSTHTNFGGSGVYSFHPTGPRFKQIHGTAVVHDAGQTATNVEISSVAGAYLSTRQVSALRFLMSDGTAGNLASGTIRIYGVAK